MNAALILGCLLFGIALAALCTEIEDRLAKRKRRLRDLAWWVRVHDHELRRAK